MKLFKLFFYSTLLLILTSVTIAIMYTVAERNGSAVTGTPSYILDLNLLESVLQLIVTFGPLQVALHFREKRRITNLFLFTAAAGSLTFVSSTLLVFLEIRPQLSSGIWLVVDRIVAIVALFAAVAFLVACYSVKEIRIKTAFTWIANTYIFAILVGIISILFKIKHWPVLQGQATPHLAQIPENIVFLFLLYRSNLIPGTKEFWKTEVASIGSPEN